MSQTSRREALKAQQLAQAKAARRMRMIGLGAAVAAVLLAVLLIVALVNGGSTASASYPKNANEAKNGVLLATVAPKPDAPKIEVYIDFQCPLCRAAEERYGQTLVDLARAGDVVVTQRTVTFMDGNLSNTASARAALAATCADNAGKYAEMTAAIFAQQEAKEVVGSIGYSDAMLRNTLPAQVGIAGADLTTYQQCYDTKAPSRSSTRCRRRTTTRGFEGHPRSSATARNCRFSPWTTPRTRFRRRPSISSSR